MSGPEKVPFASTDPPLENGRVHVEKARSRARQRSASYGSRRFHTMSDVRKVVLLINTSREHTRGLLDGIPKYARRPAVEKNSPS